MTSQRNTPHRISLVWKGAGSEKFIRPFIDPDLDQPGHAMHPKKNGSR